ncbi:MAG: ParB family transcriptional regulator, chromosome partitioning protein [Chthoniobacter sp.]|jgi:hypothetical protein|nr:ParB family transcriptional regulator, chromosome partitioning protein [Chthoniobacter sp.]
MTETPNAAVLEQVLAAETDLAGSAGNYADNGNPSIGENMIEETIKPADRSPIEQNSVVMVQASELKPHPLNVEIYGSELEEEFVETIRRNGIYQPILITRTNTIIAGHRRHAAAVKLGIEDVAAVVFHSTDQFDICEALVQANKQRVKTNEQIGREFNALVEVENERSKLRMANHSSEGMQPVAGAENGTTRDLVAKKIGGISGVSAERAGAVGRGHRHTRKEFTREEGSRSSRPVGPNYQRRVRQGSGR